MIEGSKTCPDCAEEVKSAARVCRYCGYRFDDSPAIEQPTPLPGSTRDGPLTESSTGTHSSAIRAASVVGMVAALGGGWAALNWLPAYQVDVGEETVKFNVLEALDLTGTLYKVAAGLALAACVVAAITVIAFRPKQRAGGYLVAGLSGLAFLLGTIATASVFVHLVVDSLAPDGTKRAWGLFALLLAASGVGTIFGWSVSAFGITPFTDDDHDGS